MLAKRVEVIEESTESEYEDDDSDVADNGTKTDHGQDEDAYFAVEKKMENYRVGHIECTTARGGCTNPELCQIVPLEPRKA